MTKKKKSIIIAAVVVIGAIGTFGSHNTETTETAAEVSEHSFLLDYDLQTADVKNGTGDTVIGERAYITIPSEKLSEITGEDIKEFADSNVDESSYNWVSIMTDSDEGICFTGSNVQIATYGKLDEDGAVLESLGVWIKGNDGYTYKQNEPGESE